MLEYRLFSSEFPPDMTLSDITGWTGVTPSIDTCVRGTFYGKIIFNLNIPSYFINLNYLF